MNTLILENDRSKARTPRMSACKPVVCDSSVEDRTKPLGMFRTEIRRFTRGRGEARRSEEKRGEAGESPGAFRAPGQGLLPAVRAVAGTWADAFLTERKSD